MRVLDSFPSDLNDKKLAWVIRHADRLGELDQLSEQGKKNAFDLGQRIKNLPIKAIYTSPTERCVETARILASSLDWDIPIILDNTIAEVGVYVTDMQKALDTYHTLGKEEFFHRLLTDEQLEGYNRFSIAGKKISTFIKDNTIDTGITLFITHNFIIRMLNHYIQNFTYKDKLLKVNPLEGIIIEVN